MPNQRKQWDPVVMESAVRAVCSNEMGYMKASKLHNVPMTTVKRFVAKVRQEVS